MKEVTDPALLAELEQGGEVTDPALLAQLEGTEPEGKSLAGFGHNVMENGGEILSGLGNLAVSAYNDPMETGKAVVKSIPGTVKQMANDYAVPELMQGDLGAAASKLGNTAYEKPVSTALDILPLTGLAGKAGKLGVSAAEKVAGSAGKIGSKLGHFAEGQAVKAMGPTTSNLEEMGKILGGPQGVRDAGRYLLDQKVVQSGASAEDMTARLDALADRAGRHTGETRQTASALGPTPTPEEINAMVTNELGSKYGTGLRSGEARGMKNAMNELTKQNPQNIQDLSAVATDMNSFAKGPRSLVQPQEATTDVANIIARESDKAVENNLTGTLWENKLPDFDAEKAEVGLTRGLQQITGRTQYRDMGGTNTVPMSKLGVMGKTVNAVAPHSRVADYSNRVSNMLKKAPQFFGKNGAALQEAAQKGGNALSITTYILQQRDAEFRQQLQKLAEEGNEQ